MGQCMWFILSVASVLFACYGNDGKIQTEYVEGVVMMDGEPLASAIVTFHPVDEQNGREAYGLTDKDGKYTLTIDGGREEGGTQPGEYNVYNVTISKLDVPEPTSDPDKSMDAQNKSLTIPKQYQNKETSGLQVMVEEGDNEIYFELVGEKK